MAEGSEDEVSLRGQKLVPARTRRRNVEASAPARGADEDRAPDLTPDTRMHTAHDATPPEVRSPAARDRPTIGIIELTDDAKEAHEVAPPLEIEDQSDGTLRTFDDLIARFPIGDGTGQYYIHVTRRNPPSYLGIATRGVLRPISTPLDLRGFIEEYGGGEYELIVYGPPKRGGLIDPVTQLIKPKALTRPVRFTVPYAGEGGHPPNPEAAHQGDDESQDMRDPHEPLGVPRAIFGRGATPANAKMYEAELRHRETMDERRRREEREEAQEHRATEGTMFDLLTKQHERAMALVEEDRRQLRRKLEERDERDRRGARSEIEGVASVVQALIPKGGIGDVQAVRDQHARELERLENTHRNEVETLRRTHQAERERLEQNMRHDRDTYDTRVKAIEEAAGARVRVAEERLEQHRVEAAQAIDRARADARADLERRLEEQRRDFDRQLQSQKDHYELRLSDEARQRERDDRLREQTTSLQVATAVSPLQSKIVNLEADKSRLQAEVERLQTEVRRSGDLAGQIEKFSKTAEQLGFQKNEGGSDEPMGDWKDSLAKMGLGFVQNLPQLLESAAKTAQAARAAPPAVAVPSAMPYAQQPQVTSPGPVRHTFTTEDAGAAPPLQADAFTPTMLPTAVPPRMPAPAAPVMPVAQVPTQAIQPAQSVPPSAPVASVPPPQPTAPPAAASGGQVAAQPTSAEVDGAIMQIRPHLESWCESGAEPEQVAALLLSQIDEATARAYLPGLTPSHISEALIRNGHHASVLVKRKGTRFLAAVHKAMAESLQKAGAGG